VREEPARWDSPVSGARSRLVAPSSSHAGASALQSIGDSDRHLARPRIDNLSCIVPISTDATFNRDAERE
jgi:hypothetical protein